MAAAVMFGERGFGGRSAAEWFEHGLACERAERRNLLRDAGLLDEAVEAFRTAVGERPRLASGWYNLGDLLSEPTRPPLCGNASSTSCSCCRRSCWAI